MKMNQIIYAKRISLAALLVFILTGCSFERPERITSKKADRVVKIDLSDHQTFNDTDGDGYGEFQGWGTSLCWWANRVGYSEKLTDQAAEAFFDPDKGLGLNIGRYNIGGGDNVTDKPVSGDSPSNDFLHPEHIKRSDSIVPSYAVDVTRIDLTANTADYYEQNFDRTDFECGYAWNYDWEADKRQINVLKAAQKSYGEDFITEAFSNSPPYFMTVTGCSSGSIKGTTDNLREDSYHAFACYLTDVIEHLDHEGTAHFQSVSPMNEPATNYWTAYSEKQEGCHFSPGKSQSEMITALNVQLKEKDIDILISASDETSINTAISSFKKLSDDAKLALSRIDTHSYQGDKRNRLRETALDAGKNLWMSEVDGTFSLGKKSGPMEAALGFADAITKDMGGMYPSAWIMWNAADMHIDSGNEFDTLTREQADEILAKGEPFWGIAIADHDSEEILLSKKYYGFGQYTKYIRPGYCIVSSGQNTLAAYDPAGNTVVVVAYNPDPYDQTWRFDLRSFSDEIKSIKAIRTSGDLDEGENWSNVSDSDDIDISVNLFSAQIKAHSITTYIISME